MRPVLMTSAAMIAGMVPMALAVGEGADATAPLGRPSSAAWPARRLRR
jgi:multidrug efflux pump subunit AcrB